MSQKYQKLIRSLHRDFQKAQEILKNSQSKAVCLKCHLSFGCCFEGKGGGWETEENKSPQKTTFKIQKFIHMHFLEEIEMANMCMKNAYPHSEQKEM